MLRETFRKLLSDDCILSNPADLEHYGRDWLKVFPANPALVLLPRSIDEIISVVKLCNTQTIALIPSGGRTGLSAGATATNKEVILSLERLNKILEIDATCYTVTCQAGVITQTLQEAVAAKGLYFPIDFASSGSSQIGGNIATNAGGIHVVRYGNIRDWVLGLKVVTASGDLLELNGKLIKNQSGYDLRSLFIGSEGTLGIIVEATLKLTSKPSECIRALCATDSVDCALSFLANCRRQFNTLSAFEYMTAQALSYAVSKHKLKPPLLADPAHYLLLEIEECSSETHSQIEEFLSQQLEQKLISDAVVASSPTHSEELLRYRELIPETLSSHFSPHKNDLSVPVAALSPFLEQLNKLLQQCYSGIEVAIFGHLGDGNLHVNILKPAKLSHEQFALICKEADQNIFQLVKSFNGSISAEHGIGLLKKPYLHLCRSPVEINLMRQIKQIFDPKGILNPGKIFD